MKDTSITFRAPADLKAKLQAKADAQNRSLTNYIETVLKADVSNTPSPEPKRKK